MKVPKDIRSTGRKRLRKALFDAKRPYRCEVCFVTSVEPPPDAPANFKDFWPEENRTYPISLDANHINKNLLDTDPANGQWLCRPHHRHLDRQTEKGVSVVDNEFGY